VPGFKLIKPHGLDGNKVLKRYLAQLTTETRENSHTGLPNILQVQVQLKEHKMAVA
jgi:hypothetical protein